MTNKIAVNKIDKFKPIKIDKNDKELFKEFAKTRCLLWYDDPVYDMLIYYVKQVLRFRSKGLCLYGYDKIKSPTQQQIDEIHKEMQGLVVCNLLTETAKIKTLEYLKLAKEVAERLNKYVVIKEQPAYMSAMKNYEYMRETLQGVPYFHDAYIISYKQNDKDIFVKFGLHGCNRLFVENSIIYRMHPKSRYRNDGKRTQIAITIKFVNAKIVSGSIDEKMLGDNGGDGSLYFLSDLEFFKTDDGKYEFLLGTYSEYAIKLSCDYIEFVENISPYNNTYIVTDIQRQGTHYYEFQQGKIKDKYWLDTSICINECDDDDGSVMELISLFIKNYCQFAFTYINEQEGRDFVKNLRQLGGLLKSEMNILKSLEIMGVYEPSKAKSVAELSKEHNVSEERISRFEERILEIDLIKLQRTVEVLADWVERSIKTHGSITIKGI